MKLHAIFGALAFACAFFVTPAMAQAVGTVVEVPDSLVSDLRDVALLVASTALAAFLSVLPGWARFTLKVAKIDQLAQRAIENAIFKFEGDLRGSDGRVNFDAKKKILADALTYSLQQYPALVTRETVEKWKEKLAARAESIIRDAVKKA